MKRMIICILAALITLLSFNTITYAEEDILDPLEEDVKEDLKEDDPIFRGTGNISNSKGTVYDPTNAVSMEIEIDFTLNNQTYYKSIKVKLTDISLGDKYIIYYNGNVSDLNVLSNCYCCPSIGYFVRGEEERNSNLYWYNSSNEIINDDFIYFRSYVLSFNDSIASNTSGVTVSGYIEPTPEPTPVPTPEPEEPGVDPETISGNELLREILRTNRSIDESIKGIYRVLSNNSVSVDDVSDNTISDNIIFKRLEDYNTSESLALISLVLAFGALVVYIIHKSVFKIKR